MVPIARARDASVWFVRAKHGPDGRNVTCVKQIAPGEGNEGTGHNRTGNPVFPAEGFIGIAEDVLEDVAGHAGTCIDGSEDEECLEHNDELEPVFHRVP